MCIYGEYGICSLCPQEECPEKEKNMEKSVSAKIKELNNPVTFWEDVKKIIPSNYEDWQIKQWQVEAETHYYNILGKWAGILGDWTHISFCYEEIEKITSYLKNHKEEVINLINEL